MRSPISIVLQLPAEPVSAREWPIRSSTFSLASHLAMPEPSQSDALPLTVVEADHGWGGLGLGELLRHRELLYFFAWRDIIVRYKQTELGVAWAVLQPLITTGVFVVLFGLLFGKGQEPTVPEVPYALSTFCAMLVWQMFAESSTRSSESLLQAQLLISKVYFPRVMLPMSAVLAGLVDFCVGTVVLVLMMVGYCWAPSWPLAAAPLFLLMAIVASLSVGLWLSALSAIYRDFRYAQPFVVRLGLFVSPVFFAVADPRFADLPDWALFVYGLNPMAGAIEGFRWSVLGTAYPPSPLLLVPSILMTLVLFFSGLKFFRHMEGTIVDVI